MDSSAENLLVTFAELVLGVLLLIARLGITTLRLLTIVLVRIHLRHFGTARGRFLLWLSTACGALAGLLITLALSTRAPTIWLSATGILLLLYLATVMATDRTSHPDPLGPSADDLFAPWQQRPQPPHKEHSHDTPS